MSKININEAFINSAAPNADTVSNGKSLCKKGSFSRLSINEDGDIIFGQCAGSGKNPYNVSVDFMQETPVYRCSCPSRQIPCKHATGLMFAYATKPESFSAAEVPEDISQKRSKIEKKIEKKEKEARGEIEPISPEKAEKQKKAALTAQAKKIKTQLEGIEFLAKTIQQVISGGFGTVNKKVATQLETQAKQLGDYYLPGYQNALRSFINIFNENDGPDMTKALDQMTTIYALCQKGREYLNEKLSSPDLKKDTESTMEEWLGYAWQLTELKELGMVKENRELIQISFISYDDSSRLEFVDMGIWVDLSDGFVYKTVNYRPYKALKFVKEEDSFMGVAEISELCVYPGDIVKRVRWDAYVARDIKQEDIKALYNMAKPSYPEVIKEVKNSIKSPLADKNLIMLLKYEKIQKVRDNYCLTDEKGQSLLLCDDTTGRIPSTLFIFDMIPKEAMTNGAMLVRFCHDMDSMKLFAVPLTIVTKDRIIRLAY